ncbi:hypothetical protein ACFX1Q_015215 [Malus domestica]
MDQIKEVQIGDPSCDDRFIWPFEKKGTYSVKSGYHWLHSREVPIRHSRSSLLASINKQVWKNIWKLEALPKVRSFMWCILHRALATRLDLSKRHVAVSPTCPICKEEDELVEHMLLRCPWVELVWFGGQLNYKVNRMEIDTFENWLISLIQADFVFLEATKRLHGAIEGPRKSQGNQSGLNGDTQTISVWSPLDISWYKVNVVASWNSITKKGYIAIVIRGSNGRFIAARRQSITASRMEEAEAMVVLEGCKLVNHLELRKIIIESNSKEVVSSLCTSIYNGRWETFPVLWKAMQLKASFQQCRWSWVPRSANMVADKLASVKNSEMSNYTWVERPPSSIVHILIKDGLPCPH